MSRWRGALIAESEQVLCPCCGADNWEGKLADSAMPRSEKEKMREITERIPGETEFKPAQENNNWLIVYQIGCYSNGTHLVKDSLKQMCTVKSNTFTEKQILNN